MIEVARLRRALEEAHAQIGKEHEALAAARRECEGLRQAVEAALQHFDDQIHCRRPRMHPLKYAQMLRAALTEQDSK